jgi:iron complex outermembrane receptor protein
MKCRIDLVALLLGIGLSSSALAQQAPVVAEPEQQPATPPEAPPTEAAPTEPAIPEAPPPSAAAAALPLDEPATPEVTEVIAAEPSAAPTAAADEIVVTGTHIRRSTSFAPAAPVEVLDRKQLERSGATNLADVVSTLTSSQGSGFQGAGNTTTASAGTSAANLRGLGTGATLVLINGRRLVPSGGGIEQHFGDLSVIPLAAVERIEVLKGGGSAVYGADAVGGVINVITRRNWDGARVEVDGQSTTRFDQRDYTVTGAWGASSERSRVMLATSYFRRSELDANKRDFARGYAISQQGNPGTYVVLGLQPGRLRFPDPGCANARGSAIVDATANGMTLPDQTCTFDYAAYYPLLGNLERANIFGSAEFDLTKHTMMFAEVLASRMHTDGVSSPSYPVPPPLPVVPANHIDNPFGRPASFLGRPLGAAAGPGRNTASDDTLRVVAGLKGDFEAAAPESFLESWQWELHASWGVSRYNSQIQDNLRKPLQDALNSCSNPNDLSGCFNPFYSAIDGTGTPNSQHVIDGFSGLYNYTTEHFLQTYNAGLNGSLFALPGGDVGLAIGSEYRREARATQADHAAELESYGFLIGNTDSKAKRDIASAYLELLWPFYHGIELQTAARVEYYSDIDQASPSPFAGLTVTPADIAGRNNVSPVLRRLQLRGQATSAFRAPTVYQSNPGYAIVPTTLTVANSAAPVYVPVQAFGNPDLKAERALVLSAGLTWQPLDELDIKGEIWSYDYSNRIVAENAQQALSRDEMLMASGGSDPRVIRDPMTGDLERIQVKQVNIDGAVVTQGIDFGTTVTLTGATFGGSSNAWGAFGLGVQGTYTLSYRFPRSEAGSRTVPNTSPVQSLPALHCDADSCEAAGSRNVKNFAPPLPRLRLNFPVTWSHLGHGAAIIGHFTSALEDDNLVGPDGKLGRVDPWLTVDLQYGYTLKDVIGHELTVRVGVYNVFDAAPPRAAETAGFETLIYDPRGRMVYAKLIGGF